MTTLIEPALPATGAPTPSTSATTPTGSWPGRMVKAELLKIWTTNAWWIIGIIAFAGTALALLINVLTANDDLNTARQMRAEGMPDFSKMGPDVMGPGAGGPAPGDVKPGSEGGLAPEEIAAMKADWLDRTNVAAILVRNAAAIYTSGQFIALLLVAIIGTLIVTNEFFHQTATTTFLSSPQRTRVIMSKLAAGLVIAFGFWAVITAIDIATGATYFAVSGYDTSLAVGPVLRSAGLNLLAFLIWMVIGIGFGALLRSQTGATITEAAMYLLSFPIAFAFFGLIREYVIEDDKVWSWMIAVPGVASQVMTTAEPTSLGMDGTITVQWWHGTLVLVGYGLVAGLIGTWITRRRDIS